MSWYELHFNSFYRDGELMCPDTVAPLPEHKAPSLKGPQTPLCFLQEICGRRGRLIPRTIRNGVLSIHGEGLL